MAQKAEIIKEIEALAVHCRPPLMGSEQRTSWLSDWCSDLGGYPIEAIHAACRAWRHTGETKFPVAGKLLPLVRQNDTSRHGERHEPWRPATDAGFAAMTLREKAREHEILAAQSYRKAGPMFRNTSGTAGLRRPSGVHLTVAEMSPEWRHWTEAGHRHAAEAKRLREQVRNYHDTPHREVA